MTRQKQPPDVFYKNVLSKISQYSQENTCARVSFCLRSATLLTKRFWHKFSPVNFAKFLGTPFLQDTSRRLLLQSEEKELFIS